MSKYAQALQKQVCFDALDDHRSLAESRAKNPEWNVVGRCAHHNGKCSDILSLMEKAWQLAPFSDSDLDAIGSLLRGYASKLYDDGNTELADLASELAVKAYAEIQFQ